MTIEKVKAFAYDTKALDYIEVRAYLRNQFDNYAKAGSSPKSTRNGKPLKMDKDSVKSREYAAKSRLKAKLAKLKE